MKKIELFKNDLPDDLEFQGDLAIDTEAMGLNVLRDRLCLVQFSDETGQVYLVQFTNKKYHAPNLSKLFSDKSRCKIFHFARFDLAMIKHYLKIDLQNIFCTKTASRLVRTYTERHSLIDLCKTLLDTNMSKQQQTSDWGQDTLSPEQCDYAASDVLYLHRLRDILTIMLQREDRLELAKKVFESLPTRAELDIAGWGEVDIFAHH